MDDLIRLGVGDKGSRFVTARLKERTKKQPRVEEMYFYSTFLQRCEDARSGKALALSREREKVGGSHDDEFDRNAVTDDDARFLVAFE